MPRLYLEGRSMNYGAMTPSAMRMPKSGTVIEVIKEPLISEFEIVNAELVKVDIGMALLLQLTDRGARALYRASVANSGNRMVLTVNGNPIGFRRLDGAINDGNFYSFVELRNEVLSELVLELKDSIFYLQNKAERPR
ncbi:MAG: hypothetical protein GWO81_03370 [Verrucomicrobia bacterium]|nr:hypothetical protein [Verrucomicrobiota bacterium]